MRAAAAWVLPRPYLSTEIGQVRGGGAAGEKVRRLFARAQRTRKTEDFEIARDAMSSLVAERYKAARDGEAVGFVLPGIVREVGAASEEAFEVAERTDDLGDFEAARGASSVWRAAMKEAGHSRLAVEARLQELSLEVRIARRKENAIDQGVELVLLERSARATLNYVEARVGSERGWGLLAPSALLIWSEITDAVARIRGDGEGVVTAARAFAQAVTDPLMGGPSNKEMADLVLAEAYADRDRLAAEVDNPPETVVPVEGLGVVTPTSDEGTGKADASERATNVREAGIPQGPAGTTEADAGVAFAAAVAAADDAMQRVVDQLQSELDQARRPGFKPSRVAEKEDIRDRVAMAVRMGITFEVDGEECYGLRIVKGSLLWGVSGSDGVTRGFLKHPVRVGLESRWPQAHGKEEVTDPEMSRGPNTL